jgi:hypothetical protein
VTVRKRNLGGGVLPIYGGSKWDFENLVSLSLLRFTTLVARLVVSDDMHDGAAGTNGTFP